MALALVLTFMSVSCQRELPMSCPPEYQKPLRFTLDRPETVIWHEQNNVKTVNSCEPGDSVTVFLPTVYTGAYIYKATYQWVLEARQNSEVVERRTIVDENPCKQNSLPPKWTFVAPDSVGEYIVYFRATYNYSASTPNGALYGSYPISSGTQGYEDKSSVYGRITVQ